MKTILFTQPNSPLIQQLQQEGKEFILAEDPIKTLKAMKKIKPDGYTVLADENFTRHLEVAKKFGYQEYKKERKVKDIEILETIFESVKKDYSEKQAKLEQDFKNKEIELKNRFETEHREKLEQLEQEKQSVK